MPGLSVRHRIRREDLVVFVLSLPLAALSAIAVWEAADATWLVPALVAIAVIHLSLLVRGRLPWVTLVLTGIGALALLASPAIAPSVTGLPGPLPAALLPSAAMFGVAIYSVAAHARSYRWLAIVLGVAGAVEVVASLWNGIPWLFSTALPEVWRVAAALVGVLMVLLAYACGRWRALSAVREDLSGQWEDVAVERDAAHLDSAVTRQQTRMAREVQAVVAENLDAILSRAREGRVAFRRAPGLAADALADITAQGEEALGRVQSLLTLLDDPHPDAEQLLSAQDEGRPVLAPEHALSPQPQLADLPKLIDAARGEGLAVTLSVEGERGELPVAAQLALYRTAQEALTNTVQHGSPGAVATVEMLWESAGVAVTIEDETPGADSGGDGYAPPEYVEGRGLRVVRERLESLGGYLEVDQLEGGYRVRGVVPRVHGTS